MHPYSEIRMSSGKVKPFLRKLCNAILFKEFDFNESGNDIFKMLTHEDVFPTIGIEETLIKNFKCEPEEFADWYLHELKNKGLVYLYILHHIINPPQKKIKETI